MMRALLLLFALIATPAVAETQSYGERTQETIPVGDNRFLIFVGAPDGTQVGYTVDMLKIDDGIPYYIPLFMEEFNHDTKKPELSYGVAFQAATYHYDKEKQILDFRTLEPETKTRTDYKYKLDTDILHLKLVTTQSDTCSKNCHSKQLFRAAPTEAEKAAVKMEEKPAEKTVEKPAEKAPEKPAETPAEKPKS